MCSSQKDSKEPQRSNRDTKAQLRGGILTKNYEQDPKQRKCLQRTQVWDKKLKDESNRDNVNLKRPQKTEYKHKRIPNGYNIILVGNKMTQK